MEGLLLELPHLCVAISEQSGMQQENNSKVNRAGSCYLGKAAVADKGFSIGIYLSLLKNEILTRKSGTSKKIRNEIKLQNIAQEAPVFFKVSPVFSTKRLASANGIFSTSSCKFANCQGQMKAMMLKLLYIFNFYVKSLYISLYLADPHP